MNLIQVYGKEIISLIVPLLVWALNYFLRPKAKILLASPHAFTFLVQEPLRDSKGEVVQPSQTVYTQSLQIRSAGKVPISNMEVIFNWKPMYMNLWPPRHYDEVMERDERCTIKFDSLAPGEFFHIELLSINNKLPDVLAIRSDQCIAENIIMFPQPFLPLWKRRIASVLMFSGLGLCVYLLIILLQFVLLQTPLGIQGTL